MKFPSKENIRLSLPRCPVCEAQVHSASILEADESLVPGGHISEQSFLQFFCGAKLIWDYRIPAISQEKVKDKDHIPWRWRTQIGCRTLLEEKLQT